MANFAANIFGPGMNALQAAFAKPDAELPPEEKLNYLVVFACAALVEYLRIHPYANGNGHCGRLIVWLILAKFGFWSARWPLDDSPSYGELLWRYRNGDKIPLHQFVMQSIVT